MIDKMRLQAWLQLPNATRLNIFNETARRLGLPATAVEKDWWVVHTLALVFSMECAPALIFKGGTSLSKGWGLIQRFSEDIDLAIDREYLGYPGNLNRQAINKLRKKSYEFMTKTFLQELTTKFTEAGFTGVKVGYQHTGQSDQDPVIVEIYYPKLTERDTYLKPGVLVEVGCRSLREPVTDRTFTTMVAEQFNDRPFADASVTIPVVNPERTFLEKIFLLHEEFQKPADKIRVNRLSRHLYDIDKLSQSAFAKLALNDTGLYQTIVEHRSRFTSIAGVDYENHSPDKLAFVPPAHLLRDWEADYRQMRENMIYGNPLTFTELIQNLSTLQTRINNNTLVAELEKTAFQQTEVGEIPNDWQIKQLREVINRVEYGSSAKSNKEGKVPVLRMGNIQNGKFDYSDLVYTSNENEIKKYLLEKNDVLFNRTNTIDLVGKTGIYKGEIPAIFAGYLIRIHLKKELLNADYLNYWLNNKHAKSYGHLVLSVAVGQANINGAKLKTYPIALPPTLAEQTAIATTLTDADALIAQLEKLIAKKKAIKQGTMQELLKPKGGWKEKKLGEVAPLQRGFDLPHRERIAGKFPVVYSNGILNYHQKFMVKGPGIVTGRSGTIGKVNFIENDFWPHNTTLWVTAFRNCIPKFIYYLFLQIKFERFSSGSGVPTLNRNDLHDLNISIPSSLEQTRIAQILSDMDAEIERLEQRLAKQKMLKQGMMQVLLTGKIRLV